MKTVHMTLQGKGGVGKTVVAMLLAQYLQTRDEPAVCIDADPVNASFAGYKGLDVAVVDLLDADKKISERKFDAVMERLLTEDRDFVIDNGSSSFVSLSAYLVENDVPAMIAEANKQLVIHAVVTGGQALADTLHGLSSILLQMPESAKVCVWLNEYFGPIEREGKSFEAMKVYAENKGRIHGLVRIDRESSDTFRKDLETMLDMKLTFAEAIESEAFGLMPKQRLAQLRRRYNERIEAVLP